MGRNREPSQDEDDDPWVSTLAIAPNLGPESSSYPRIVMSCEMTSGIQKRISKNLGMAVYRRRKIRVERSP